ADKKIEMSRFHDKNVIEVPVTRAAKDAEGLLNAIVNGELAPRLVSSAASFTAAPAGNSKHDAGSRSFVSQIYVHLITG
ncbi:PTS fructose transporter subunit IIBC, partial [Klebsiella pneumoniae]